MKLTVVKMSTLIADNLKLVSATVNKAYTSSPTETRASVPPRLVAVSKTKPKEMIIEAYEAGQRHFGENYIQELTSKSSDPDILVQCPDIKWHFIGQLQSNKAKDLIKCPNIAMVETVTSIKQAGKLNNLAASQKLSNKLPVMVQVNTSGEENKNGVEPKDTLQLVRHLRTNCAQLEFAGLMTVGALARSLAAKDEGDNPDFRKLLEVRSEICKEENLEQSRVELSMGMSNDFEEAIRLGSTNVRVGSSIFGSRSVMGYTVNTVPKEQHITAENITSEMETKLNVSK